MLRSARNYDMNSASLASALRCLDGSRTIQSQKDETDINEIMRRFGKTGVVPMGVARVTLDDFADVIDFRTAMDRILEAKQSFMAMPADVRARFGNDPALFVEFCSDEKNLEEMRKMGLAVPKPVVVESEELKVLKEIRDVGKFKADAGKAS